MEAFEYGVTEMDEGLVGGQSRQQTKLCTWKEDYMEHKKNKGQGDRIYPETWCLVQPIAEGTAKGKRVRSRLKYTYIDQVVKDVGVNSYRKVQDIVQDRAG